MPSQHDCELETVLTIAPLVDKYGREAVVIELEKIVNNMKQSNDMAEED